MDVTASLWKAFDRGDLSTFLTIISNHHSLLDEDLILFSEQSYNLTQRSASSPRKLQNRPRAAQPHSRINVNWRDSNGYTLLHHIATSLRQDAAAFAYALLSCPAVDIYIKSSPYQLTAFHLALGFSNLAVGHAIFIRESRELSNLPIYKLRSQVLVSSEKKPKQTTSSLSLAEVPALMGVTPFEVLPATDLFFSQNFPADGGERWPPPGLRDWESGQLQLLGLNPFQDLEAARKPSSGVARETFAFYPHQYSFDGLRQRKLTSKFSFRERLTEGSSVFGLGNNKNFSLGLGDSNLRQKSQPVQLGRTSRAFSHQKCSFVTPVGELLSQLSDHLPPRKTCARCAYLPTECCHKNDLGSEWNLFSDEIHRDYTRPGLGSDSDSVSETESRLSQHYPPLNEPQNEAEGEMPFSLLNSQLEISDVAMSNFHSAILTHDDCSNLYVCGHGPGGRLGLGDEQTRVNFTCLDSGPLAHTKVVAIALGSDHTLALTHAGAVYSWGSNRFGQLGHKMARNDDTHPVQLTPQVLRIPKHKRTEFVAIAASPLHSVVVSSSGDVFTFGKNVGQLGMSQEISEPLQLTPYQVDGSTFAVGSNPLVAASETCTAVLGKTGIWVFSHYLIRYVSIGPSFDTSLASSVCDRSADITQLTASRNTVCFLSQDGSPYVFRVPSPAHGRLLSKSMKTTQIYTPCTAGQRVASVAIGEDESIIFVSRSGLLWKTKVSKVHSSTAESASKFADTDSRLLPRYELPVIIPTTEPVVIARANPLGSVLGVCRRERFDMLDMSQFNDAQSLDTALDVPVPYHPGQKSLFSTFNRLMDFLGPDRSWPGLSFYADIWSLFPLVPHSRDRLESSLPADEPYPRPQNSIKSRYKYYTEERARFVSRAFARFRSDSSLYTGPIDSDMSLSSRHTLASPGSVILLYSKDSDIALPVFRFLLVSRFPSLTNAICSAEFGHDPRSDEFFTVSRVPENNCPSRYPDAKVAVTFPTLRMVDLLLLVFYIHTDVSNFQTDEFMTTSASEKSVALNLRAVWDSGDRITQILTHLFSHHTQVPSANPVLPVTLFSFIMPSNLDLSSPHSFELSSDARRLFVDADVLVVVAGGTHRMPMHSAILESRCAPFSPLFNTASSSAWFPSIQDEPEANKFGIRMRFVDMKHSSVLAFHCIRAHLYTGITGFTLFRDFTASSQEDFIDFVLEVALLADELLLDPLSHGCQRVLLRLTTAKNLGYIFNTLEHCIVDTYRRGAALYSMKRAHSLFRIGDPLEVLPLFDHVRGKNMKREDVSLDWFTQNLFHKQKPVDPPRFSSALKELTETYNNQKSRKHQTLLSDSLDSAQADVFPQSSSSTPETSVKPEYQNASDGLTDESETSFSPLIIQTSSPAAEQGPTSNGSQLTELPRGGSGADVRSSPVSALLSQTPSQSTSVSSPSRALSSAISTPIRPRESSHSDTKNVVLDMRASAPVSSPHRNNPIKSPSPLRYLKFAKGRVPPRPNLHMDSPDDSSPSRRDDKTCSQNVPEGPSSWSAVSSLEAAKRSTSSPSLSRSKEAGSATSAKIVYSDVPAREEEAAKPKINPLANTKVADLAEENKATSKPSIFSVQHQPPSRPVLYFSPIIDPTIQSIASSPSPRLGGKISNGSTRKSRRAANVKMPTPNMQDILTEQEFEQWWAEESKRLQAVAENEDASLAMALALAEDENEAGSLQDRASSGRHHTAAGRRGRARRNVQEQNISDNGNGQIKKEHLRHHPHHRGRDKGKDRMGTHTPSIGHTPRPSPANDCVSPGVGQDVSVSKQRSASKPFSSRAGTKEELFDQGRYQNQSAPVGQSGDKAHSHSRPRQPRRKSATDKSNFDSSLRSENDQRRT